LRIEAGRRAWGAELGPDETPWEAGLGFAVALDKRDPFIGRDALLRQKADGLRKRLLILLVDDPTAFPWGGEPILMNDESVGELTSVGYSRKRGRAIAMGYVRATHSLDDAQWLAASYAIDIAGERFAVTPRFKLD
jgi:glycine cleavage system aminomethyltransferase T